MMGISIPNLSPVSQIRDQNGFLMTVGRDGKEHPRKRGGLNCSHNFETPTHLADVRHLC